MAAFGCPLPLDRLALVPFGPLQLKPRAVRRTPSPHRSLKRDRFGALPRAGLLIRAAGKVVGASGALNLEVFAVSPACAMHSQRANATVSESTNEE